jgi:dienelactone hydrolase
MKQGTFLGLRLVSLAVFAFSLGHAAGSDPAPGLPLGEYFRSETELISTRCLADIRSLDDWKSRREEYRRQLQEMLGLWPMPEKTDLNPVITGKLEEDAFTVEKLHFQASPGLYVTANLYLPKNAAGPAPAILYACGHSRVVTNGVSCGNKAGYQHHGAWFARNGYVCLMIDSLQLGEIQGSHRGTHSEGQWWWNSRGYTPAGVETWFGIRALDYLCSRPEVDRERIGMTGRSGGGAYTWLVAALDERVKVAAPIAGITDLENHVVDGTVEGHCDCMFFVNTYRWDFAQLAALLAPRPLLIGNSDKDRIFPLDGVLRVHQKTRRIYHLYGQTNNLALLITDGPHADTQDLQLPVFRWFNRFLKQEDPVIEMAARKFFAPLQLKVFDTLPQDQVNTKIQETFVHPASQSVFTDATKVIDQLRQNVFAGWPAEHNLWPLIQGGTSRKVGLRVETYHLETQPGVLLRVYFVHDTRIRKPEKVILTVLDSNAWSNSPAKALWLGGELPVVSLKSQMQEQKAALAFFAPRMVEPGPAKLSPMQAAQVRRRFMLLGQTLDGMRVWDIRCALRGLQAIAAVRHTPVWVQGSGPMGVNAAYAALFEPEVARLDLKTIPRSHLEGPDYLNVLKIWDIPQLLAFLGSRCHDSNSN